MPAWAPPPCAAVPLGPIKLLMLTDTVGGQIGAIVPDGIVASPALNGFTAKFNITMGPTMTGILADGVGSGNGIAYASGIPASRMAVRR